MKSEHQFVQQTLEDMLSSTTDNTIQALETLTEQGIPATIRVMLLKRLAESWEISPVRLHLPQAITALGKYASSDAMFAIQCGKLTSYLLTIKNGMDYGNNYN